MSGHHAGLLDYGLNQPGMVYGQSAVGPFATQANHVYFGTVPDPLRRSIICYHSIKCRVFWGF